MKNFGNIYQVSENSYIVVIPKAIKLGIFTNLETAKQVAETRKKDVDLVLDELNLKIVEEVNKIKVI